MHSLACTTIIHYLSFFITNHHIREIQYLKISIVIIRIIATINAMIFILPKKYCKTEQNAINTYKMEI